MIPGWKEEIQAEYLNFIRSHPTVTPRDIAIHFDTPECCAVYWLTDLARDGRIRMLAIQAVGEDEIPCDPDLAARCQGKPSCPVVDRTKVFREAS